MKIWDQKSTLRVGTIAFAVTVFLNSVAIQPARALSIKQPGRYQYSDLECANGCFEDYGRKIRSLEDATGLVGLFAIICTAGLTLPAVADSECDRKKEIERELQECLAGCVRTVK
ncbi:MAG: hypothetical protein AB7F66_16610 [Bacteriovoracia bacterium]